MAPTCSNCGGTEFLWAGELKTGGRFGQGPLSLRGGGELPLGTRICRACGHADLFLRDVKILNAPHHWKPGEFVPISGPAPGKTHSPSQPHAPAAPSPLEPAPMEPAPLSPPPAPPSPLEPEVPPPEPPIPELTPMSPHASAPNSDSPDPPAAPKPPSRRRSSRSKKSAEPAPENPPAA